MLAKSESMSRLTMKVMESRSIISVAKLKESFTLYPLVVNDSKIVTENFACLSVGLSNSEKIWPEIRHFVILV